MDEGKGRRRARMVAVAVVAGLVGYLIGPPMVNAAANLVVIKDSGSKRKARVLSGGAVKVRPNGGFTDVSGSLVTQFPVWGVDRFATGGANAPAGEQACDSNSVVTEVVLQGGTDSLTVTLTGDTGSGSTTDVVWKGTVGANDHLSDTFGSGVFSGQSLHVTATGTVGQGEWFVYGFCFGAASNLPAKARMR